MEETSDYKYQQVNNNTRQTEKQAATFLLYDSIIEVACFPLSSECYF